MTSSFSLITFNLHGFNQGQTCLHELCTCEMPSVIFLQEQWLSAANSDLLLNFSDNYLCYLCSPMDKVLSTGILRGRPYGGVAIMVRVDTGAHSSLVAKSDRFIAVRIDSFLLINIYASSANSQDDKFLIDADLLSEIDIVMKVRIRVSS